LSEIRNCSRADLAAVAALFQKTFRDPSLPAPPALAVYLDEAFLRHPWYDPEIASRVHVDQSGRVTGFIGVFPGRFEQRGRAIRAAIAGTLMVESPEREPLAGAKLLRAVVKGPQDISISETTNLVSQRLWEPLGGKVIPLLSLDWFRVFKPGAAALALLTERSARGRLLAPGAHLADRVGGSWTRRNLEPGKVSERLAIEHDPTDAAFAAAVLELAQDIELRPAWDQGQVEWLLALAAQKERYGALQRAILRTPKGDPLGCYVYHARAGGVGRVLQVFAQPRSVGTVLDALFRDAFQAGLSGLRGRCSVQLTSALLTRRCIFLHRASTVIHTAEETLASAVLTGDALITGLAGETWTRLIGDEFI
jgi:hypothetical protein